MGARFCFFTDPALLGVQTAAQAFGPQPAAGGNDLFRITHRHPVTSAPAVAICDGILCAQEDGAGGLTLILKPSQTPPFEAPVVSYFIYKGVAKTSLLSGNAVLDETDQKANDLTKRVASTWKKLNANVLTGSRAGLGLDRDSAFLHVATDPNSKVFTDADPVERLFTYPHPTVQLPVVSAGDVIGAFGSDCGLEIVLLRLGYRPKLKFARTADNVIAVPSLGGGPRPADDADWFAHWHAKEQALAYMDPAAWFGAFVQAKLYKRSGASTSKVKGSDVYDELLTTFANRNVAWLDIRNNYSCSYNLFGLYDGLLRFVSRTEPNQISDLDFRSGGWPLRKLEIADLPGSRRGRLHGTALRLPSGAATAPAVMISKGFANQLGAERPSLRVSNQEVDSAHAGFLTPLRIAFPAKVDGGQDVLTASYTRVNLYETAEGSPQPGPFPGAASDEFLDGLFRLGDLRFDQNFAGDDLRVEIFYEEALVDLVDEGLAYAAAIGMIEDAGSVSLFAFPTCFLPGNLAGQAQTFTGLTNRQQKGAGRFEDWLANLFPSAAFTKMTVDGGTATEADGLIARPGDHVAPLAHGDVENWCLIVLDKADHAAMLSAVDAGGGAAAHWPIWSRVSSVMVKTDPQTQARYIERILLASRYHPGSASSKIVRSDLPWSKPVIEYANT